YPIQDLPLLTAAPLLLWLVLMLAHLLARPLPLLRVARRVDAAIGSRERLATALELSARPEHAPIEALQQEDARAFADRLQPRMLPLHIEPRPLLVGLLLVVAAAVSALLPNPQDEVLRERELVRKSLEQEAAEIEQVRQQIAQNQALSPEERELLEQQLANL